MNDFEDQLRRALRPIDPPEGFATRVMRALPDRREPAAVTPIFSTAGATRSSPRTSLWARLSAPVALAASLLVAVLVGQHVAVDRARLAAQQERDAGLAASRELMQALRVTSQKLDLAYQAVREPPPAAGGAEENRS
jgi:negative regulator of sigma E activity